MAQERCVQLINLQAGNLESLRQAMRRLDISVREVTDGAQLDGSRAVILPGVGAFGAVARRAWATGIAQALRGAIERKQPLLGICLGMQLLADDSEEQGQGLGLGVIPGQVSRLPMGLTDYRVPNVGWRSIHPTAHCDERYKDIFSAGSFYHIHSYYVAPTDETAIWATLPFSDLEVPVAIGAGSVVGVQFHPEKSQDDGLDFLQAWTASVFGESSAGDAA